MTICCTIIPPIDAPTMCAASMPRWSSRLTASDAMDAGLVTRVAADDRLDEAVQEAVEQLLAMPRAPLEMTKDALTAIGRPALATAWADPDLISWAGGEPERLEAARAYVARNLGKKN